MRKISVIIPTYTAVKYLEICLESIYKNQYNPMNEVVLVVDGTYDLNKHIIEKYSKLLNLKPIIFEENKGLSFATNYGFYNATNQLCLNINDDNVCPYQFDKILLDEYNKQQINQICSNLLIVPNQIEPRPSIFKPFIINDFGDLELFDLDKFTIEEQLFRQDKSEWDSGWTFPLFISKENFIAVGGFDPCYESPHVIDWEFFIKLDKLGFYNKRIYNCNFYHFGSKSARSPESYQKEMDAHKFFQMKWGFPAYNKLLQ